MNGTALNVHGRVVRYRTGRVTVSLNRLILIILLTGFIFTDTGAGAINITTVQPLQVVQFLLGGLTQRTEECPVRLAERYAYRTLLHRHAGAAADHRHIPNHR